MKIEVEGPVVEINGDEMARVIWEMIKKKLINPFLDIEIKYFDLSIFNRENTKDQITVDAANAVIKYKVGIKCATITPDEERVKEFDLSKMYLSPNGTLRNMLGGTVFREPIIFNKNIRYVKNWDSPIIVARHAFGDQYCAKDIIINEPGKLELVFTPDNISVAQQKLDVFDFKTSGVAMAMYNVENSIVNFARSCFNYGLKRSYPVFLSTKNTILKKYDGLFKKIFEDIFNNEFANKFANNGLFYEHRLIDDMVAYVIKSKGGFVWACKNYDGDVQSDVVAQGFGSLGMMTSVLVSADGGVVLSEAAHGTVTRHFRKYRLGEKTSTNPFASIFAWTRGLKYRASFDNNIKLKKFANCLEDCCINVLKNKVYTKDIAVLLNSNNFFETEDFINYIAKMLNESFVQSN